MRPQSARPFRNTGYNTPSVVGSVGGGSLRHDNRFQRGNHLAMEGLHLRCIDQIDQTDPLDKLMARRDENGKLIPSIIIGRTPRAVREVPVW